MPLPECHAGVVWGEGPGAAAATGASSHRWAPCLGMDLPLWRAASPAPVKGPPQLAASHAPRLPAHPPLQLAQIHLALYRVRRAEWVQVRQGCGAGAGWALCAGAAWRAVRMQVGLEVRVQAETRCWCGLPLWRCAGALHWSRVGCNWAPARLASAMPSGSDDLPGACVSTFRLPSAHVTSLVPDTLPGLCSLPQAVAADTDYLGRVPQLFTELVSVRAGWAGTAAAG